MGLALMVNLCLHWVVRDTMNAGSRKSVRSPRVRKFCLTPISSMLSYSVGSAAMVCIAS
jgi:hypothetical protein